MTAMAAQQNRSNKPNSTSKAILLSQRQLRTMRGRLLTVEDWLHRQARGSSPPSRLPRRMWRYSQAEKRAQSSAVVVLI
jgi:hypothetical protein